MKKTNSSLLFKAILFVFSFLLARIIFSDWEHFKEGIVAAIGY